MRKTASQIADEVLVKCAISAELAFKVLKERAKRIPQMSHHTHETPWNMLTTALEGNPRTWARAAEKFKEPGEHLVRGGSRVQSKLDDILKNEAVYTGAQGQLNPAGIPKGYFSYGEPKLIGALRNPATVKLNETELQRYLDSVRKGRPVF